MAANSTADESLAKFQREGSKSVEFATINGDTFCTNVLSHKESNQGDPSLCGDSMAV